MASPCGGGVGSPLKDDSPDLDDMFTEGSTLNIAKVDKPRCASRYTPRLPRRGL